MNARRSFAAAALLMSNGAGAANDLAYDPQRPLYTCDQSAYSAAEVSLTLNALSRVDKTTILFIHGRGDEPSKSLRPKKSMFGLGAGVPMLERQYGAAVLMFNWNSKAASQNDRARPLSHMDEAAASLRDVIQRMRAYYTANPSTRRAVLLAHSMGTIVVQRYVERYGWNDGERLFSNVLFTGADADNVDHANWVDQIGAVETVFITINFADKMLKRSTSQRPANALPLGRDPGSPLAQGAVYIEIGESGHHEVFDKQGMASRVNVCHFFATILKGAQPDLSTHVATTLIANRRYRLLPAKHAADPCFT